MAPLDIANKGKGQRNLTKNSKMGTAVASLMIMNRSKSKPMVLKILEQGGKVQESLFLKPGLTVSVEGEMATASSKVVPGEEKTSNIRTTSKASNMRQIRKEPSGKRSSMTSASLIQSEHWEANSARGNGIFRKDDGVEESLQEDFPRELDVGGLEENVGHTIDEKKRGGVNSVQAMTDARHAYPGEYLIEGACTKSVGGGEIDAENEVRSIESTGSDAYSKPKRGSGMWGKNWVWEEKEDFRQDGRRCGKRAKLLRCTTLFPVPCSNPVKGNELGEATRLCASCIDYQVMHYKQREMGAVGKVLKDLKQTGRKLSSGSGGKFGEMKPPSSRGVKRAYMGREQRKSAVRGLSSVARY